MLWLLETGGFKLESCDIERFTAASVRVGDFGGFGECERVGDFLGGAEVLGS